MSKRAQTSIETKARRTELVDAQDLIKFVNKQTTDLFGSSCRELGKIFELMCVLCIHLFIHRIKLEKIS